MTLQSVRLPARGRVHPFNLSFLGRASEWTLHAPVTVLVGENGSGKSTLLEAIALAAEIPAAGAHNLDTDPTLEAVRPLADAIKLVWSARSRVGLFLRAEDYFGYALRLRRERLALLAEAERVKAGFAGVSPEEQARRLGPYIGSANALESAYGGDLDHRSHGESFLTFFEARLRGTGLYILDEPEAALSPLRQLALVSLVQQTVARGGQFLIATHAPILMAIPGARCVSVSEAGLQETPFDALENVQLLRAFMLDPAAFWRHFDDGHEAP